MFASVVTLRTAISEFKYHLSVRNRDFSCENNSLNFPKVDVLKKPYARGYGIGTCGIRIFVWENRGG